MSSLRCFLAVCLIGIVSCNNTSKSTVTLTLSNYKMVELTDDDPILYVTLLHACKRNSAKNSANFIICRDDTSKDLMLVFDREETSDKIVFEESSKNQGFVVIQEEKNLKPIKDATIELCNDATIPKNVKYTFGSVHQLLD